MSKPRPKPAAGRPTEARTPLARLRLKLGIDQAAAAAICARLLGSCDPRTYRGWEGGARGVPPPVILVEFRRRAANKKKGATP